MDVLGSLPESVASEVRLLQRSVERIQQPDPKVDDRFTFEIGIAVERLGVPQPLVLGAGAFGAGNSPDALELTACVFVGDQRVDAVPDLALLERLEPQLPGGATVVVLPLPRLQAHPGGPIRCLGQAGHFGARAVRHGVEGLLTAGHVAQVVGATVDDEIGRVGTVAFTDDASRHGPTEVTADVAFVELHQAGPHPLEPRIGGTRTGGIGDAVTAFARGQTHRGWIRGVSPLFLLDPARGTWGEVYITNAAISTGGDSGAPVLLGDGDQLVGHVIAGHEGVYSVVQDAEYQLSECSATLGGP